MVYGWKEVNSHKRGWKEGTDGHSSGRQLDDGEFDTMSDMLKDCGWEFSMTVPRDGLMFQQAL